MRTWIKTITMFLAALSASACSMQLTVGDAVETVERYAYETYRELNRPGDIELPSPLRGSGSFAGSPRKAFEGPGSVFEGDDK